MQINADFDQAAIVKAGELPWLDSPLAGVQRRMLERDGDEVARATSIVRYEPGSHFDAHEHELGEEYMVLDGVFSDETGDFPAGMYVRNPPGSRHRPHSEGGATIFVKLRQFACDDSEFVRIDTRRARWLDGPQTGLKMMPLYTRMPEQVQLVDIEAGAQLRCCGTSHGTEIFVLNGSIEMQQVAYPRHTWMRFPGVAPAPITSVAGAVIYLKSGFKALLARD